jgi:hypothetical protein
MDTADLEVRNATYRLFAGEGTAPTPADVAATLSCDPAEVVAAWSRLHDAHALVLDPSGQRLRMANPFSAVPTDFLVRTDGRRWFANCAWDAFGICAALGRDGTIDTSCPDCGNALRVTVNARRPDRDDLLFHCLVPARRWWEDIAFT